VQIAHFYCVAFRRPGGRDDTWTPTVAGIPKRDLLREVLSVFGKSFRFNCFVRSIIADVFV
jgi:hypothetical protein